MLMDNLDWYIGNIDRAVETDEYDNQALMNGTAWADFASAIGRLGPMLHRDDVPGSSVDRAAGYRHLMALLGNGIIQALCLSDPTVPNFGQITRTDIFKWGLDCPDCAYNTTAIRGDLTYRITGNLGTVRYFSFQINEGMANQGNIRGDQMETDAEGNFELWIGPDRRSGNWLASQPGSDTIIVRQFFSDWDNERHASFDIERVSPIPADASPDVLVATPDRVARQLAALATWLEANVKFWIDVEVMGQMGFHNSFDEASVKSEAGGAIENINAWGHYDLGPEEAMIIEVAPAPALYWSVHAGNFWWESLDYATRHTSINDHQAVLDDDGVFRAVVAHHDPGAPNWLDTMGHTKGPLLFRWVVADHGPNASTRIVAFDQIRANLPPSTPIVSPEERTETIARRRVAVQRRFRG